MRPLLAKQIIRILESNGFCLNRQRGSHMIFRHPVNGIIIVPVPFHGANKPLPIGTFLNIIKQSKLDRKIFENV